MNGHSRHSPQQPSGAPPPPQQGTPWPMLLVLVALIAWMWYWQSNAARTNHPEVDYSLFYQWLNGKSRLDRSLLGATAERVVRGARRPVLSVPLVAASTGKGEKV